MIKVGNKFRWDHFSRHFLGQHPSLASPLSTFLRLPLLLLLLLTPFSVCRRIPFYTLRCFLAFELIQILRVAFPSSLSLVLSIALSLSHTHTHTHTHTPTHTHTHTITHTHTHLDALSFKQPKCIIISCKIHSFEQKREKFKCYSKALNTFHSKRISF